MRRKEMADEISGTRENVDNPSRCLLVRRHSPVRPRLPCVLSSSSTSPRFADDASENIDPTSARTDAELNSALGLIHRESSSTAMREKFKLDAEVGKEGNNFSAGERQLRKF